MATLFFVLIVAWLAYSRGEEPATLLLVAGCFVGIYTLIEEVRSLKRQIRRAMPSEKAQED